MTKFKSKSLILLSWIAVFLWMLLIFHLSSQVADKSNELSQGVTEVIVESVKKVAPEKNWDFKRLNHMVRKNAHFFAYLILGILTIQAIRSKGIVGLKSIGFALGLCILYAISDEVHQLFVPGRGPQVKDVWIDSAGATVGIGLYSGLSMVLSKRKQHKKLRYDDN